MLLKLRDLRLSYGVEVLLDDAELAIDAGERVALVGRNGTGKSTLMKIVSGEVEPDKVKRESKPGLRIARLEQEVPAATHGTVYQVTAAGLGEAGRRRRGGAGPRGAPRRARRGGAPRGRPREGARRGGAPRGRPREGSGSERAPQLRPSEGRARQVEY